MAVRTLQDQVDAILNKRVVQPKVGGVPTPDVETASVIESLALAFMLQPKAAFYAYYLAKNGLSAAINREFAAIDTLKTTIQDLANTTYAIKDTKDLKRAQAAMLQLGAQGKLSSSSSSFSRYSSSVDDFLNKQLSKNIKRPGAVEMVRPGEEAGNSLPTDLGVVKSAHTEFLDRLYALTVGISNFVNTPFSSIVGANAVYRAKKDLDSLIVEIEADESGSQSRDAAVRLIAGRATVRSVGAPLDLRAPVIDTVRLLPPDQLLSGESAPAAVLATTAVGPFVMTTGGSLSITVDGQTVATTALNQAANAAAVLGEAVVYPVSVPANYHLFLRLDAIAGLSWVGPVNSPAGPTDQGTYSETTLTLGGDWLLENGTYYKVLKVVLNSGDPVTSPPGSATPQSQSLAVVLTAINVALGAYGAAVEFVASGSNRILLIASELKVGRISVVSSTYTMETQSNGQAGNPGATVYWPRIYTNTFHEELGFVVNQDGTVGDTPTARILEALKIVFPSLLTPTLNTDGSLALTSLVTTPGVSMELTGTWVADLGLSSSYVAESSIVSLLGEGGVVSPIGIVDLGDSFQSSTGQAAITATKVGTFEVASPLRTFSGDIIVTSALYLTWVEIDSQIRSFMNSWLEGPYASGLTTLDQVISVLIGSPSSPRRSEALAILDDLEADLLGLQTALTSPAATLPTGSASKEKLAINNIISLFTERKFDRALDLLLRCKLQEIFEVDWQSASYSGNLMKAVESIAQTDVKFPKVVDDDGFDVLSRRGSVR